jgi:NitT/TauT family transport system substrate-binding protein
MIVARRDLLVGAGALLLARPAWAQALRKVTVAGWSQPISEITNMLAEPETGFFKARGIAFDYLPGQGSGQAIQNMLTGKADIAFTDPASFFLALDKGEKLVAVYNIYPQNVFNLVARKDRGIGSLKELKGKRISVYSRGGGTWIHLLMQLHGAGLTENDVTIEVAGSLNFGPLIQGQVDAASATDTALSVARARGLKDFSVFEVRDTINLPSDIFVVTEETYRKRKALIADFLAGYRDGAQWMIDKPAEAARLAVAHTINGRDEAVNLEIIRLRNEASVSETTKKAGLGHFDPEIMQRGAELLKTLGIVKAPIDAAAVVRSDLLPL